MRENLEQAKEFFGGFSGDHRTFVSCDSDSDSFLKIICVKSVVTDSKMKQK